MDPRADSSDARPTDEVSPEARLTAYPQGATDLGAQAVASQPAFALSPAIHSWASSSHLDTQSRAYLTQTSVALDTAYERIASLRISINNMLNRIPPDAAGTGTSTTGSTDPSDTQPRHSLAHDDSIRPQHSALVLSGEQVVEELNLRAARLRSLISPSTRQRLEEFESGSRSNVGRVSAWDRLSQGDLPRLESGNPHPGPPPRPRTPPMPDLFLPNARSIQSINQDDSSTMIGRRVAARVNAPDGQSSLSSRLSLSQIEQRFQAQTAQVARQLESMTERLAAQRSRRIELASSGVQSDNSGVMQANGASAAPHAVSTADGDVRLPNPTSSGRPLRPSREVTLVDSTPRIVLPPPISRTSSDGTPLDELSAPARRSLSAAVREHIATYRDHVQVTTSQDTPRNLVNAPEVRGALVNLLSRDRDEQILLARQPEHARSGVENNAREDAPARSDPSSSPGQGRRRRGWTRLNADGDEIDSDEDDNVPPQTRRLRMRFTYGTPNVGQPATRSQTVTIEDILWRTSGSDSEADALSPDMTESCQPFLQGSPPGPAIRHPHPLPTPVEDMLIYPITKPSRRPHVICVSKYASLAGR